jgi:hypothetical protein
MCARAYLVAVVIASGLGVGQGLRAQSLGDVARQTEEQRKDLKVPVKVYTNKDLGAPRPAFVAPAEPAKPAAPSGAQSADDKAQDAAKDTAKDSDSSAPVQDQAYWSGRKTRLQSKLDHDQVLAEAMQTRIDALLADFTSRDDPIQRAGIERDRQRALSELDSLQKSIKDDKKALEDLDEEARKAGVPPGWLR